jgi:hypothetical protein
MYNTSPIFGLAGVREEVLVLCALLHGGSTTVRNCPYLDVFSERERAVLEIILFGG